MRIPSSTTFRLMCDQHILNQLINFPKAPESRLSTRIISFRNPNPFHTELADVKTVKTKKE